MPNIEVDSELLLPIATATLHEQLTKARLAVVDGLAGKPIPKPSDDV